MGVQDFVAIGCVVIAGVYFLNKTIFSSLIKRPGRKSMGCGSSCGKCSSYGATGAAIDQRDTLVSIGFGSDRTANYRER